MSKISFNINTIRSSGLLDVSTIYAPEEVKTLDKVFNGKLNEREITR